MFNRGAYTTIGDVCIFFFDFPHLNSASYHSHIYRYLICKAGRCIILTTLNKRAYARCEMYAQLPGVKPTDVPD